MDVVADCPLAYTDRAGLSARCWLRCWADPSGQRPSLVLITEPQHPIPGGTWGDRGLYAEILPALGVDPCCCLWVEHNPFKDEYIAKSFQMDPSGAAAVASWWRTTARNVECLIGRPLKHDYTGKLVVP